nr:antibiotic biosynthesis monooxygenase [uncultured Lichenicoccus sp.]
MAAPSPLDQAAPAQGVYAGAIIDLYPDKAAAGSALLHGYAAATERRPGFLEARLIRGQAPLSNHFILLTNWRSKAEREAAQSDPVIRRFRDALQPLAASPVDERLYAEAP